MTEDLEEDNELLRDENQRLREEIGDLYGRMLKGELIAASTPTAATPPIADEKQVRELVETVLSFNRLDDLANLSADHPNRLYVESVVVNALTTFVQSAVEAAVLVERNRIVEIVGTFGANIRKVDLLAAIAAEQKD